MKNNDPGQCFTIYYYSLPIIDTTAFYGLMRQKEPNGVLQIVLLKAHNQV